MQIISQIPLAEPVTLDDAKLHLRINPGDISEDRAIIAPLIMAAREYCENYTGRSFALQKITVHADEHGTIKLPRGPVVSVDSVTLDGKTVEYTADLHSGTVTVDQSGATIAYTAGYTHIPMLVRQAMLLLIGHWYANREAVAQTTSAEVDMAVRAMLNQYKGWWF